MKLCTCPAPLRSTASLERLRCLRCAGWTPHGRLPNVDRTTTITNELASIAAQLAADYGWVHSLAHDPFPHGHGTGRETGISDRTGAAIADNDRTLIVAYATITARLTERAIKALRSADEAMGNALLAAELPGPADHTQAPFHDPASLHRCRPDLTEPFAAQARRRARGEGTPT